MDDYLEIDLRKLLTVVFNNWYWVVLPAVIFGLLAYGFSSLPPSETIPYQANAQISIIDTHYPTLFGEFQTPPPPQKPADAVYERILKNPAIVSALFEDWVCSVEYACTMESFSENHLDVKIDSENRNLITLIVDAESPDNAILLANNWAILASKLDPVILYFSDQNAILLAETQADFSNEFNAALARADKLLEQNEIALDMEEARFQEVSQVLINFYLESNLESLTNDLSNLIDRDNDYRQMIRNLETYDQELRALISQLEFEENDSIINPAFGLQYLLIQNQLYNFEGTPPIEISIGIGVFDTITVENFSRMLENLTGTIATRRSNLEEGQAQLVEEISSLQAEIQSLSMEEVLLKARYDAMFDDYKKSLLIYQEMQFLEEIAEPARIALERLASDPIRTEQTGQNAMRNSAVGAVAGAFLGLASILTVNWWQKGMAEDEKLSQNN